CEARRSPQPRQAAPPGSTSGSGPARRMGHAAVIVHWLLVLLFGAHMTVVEPMVVLPAPSRAVAGPRLVVWYRPLPRLLSRHCWLLPPFQAVSRAGAPLAALPQLSATMPLVLLTIR